MLEVGGDIRYLESNEIGDYCRDKKTYWIGEKGQSGSLETKPARCFSKSTIKGKEETYALTRTKMNKKVHLARHFMDEDD